MTKNSKTNKGVSRKLLKLMKLEHRVDTLDNKLKEFIESSSRDIQVKSNFDLGLVVGFHGVVEALVKKGVVSLDEINEARLRVIEEYRREPQQHPKTQQTAPSVGAGSPPVAPRGAETAGPAPEGPVVTCEASEGV